MLTPRVGVIALSAVSAAAMLYVGLFQIRLVEHMSCPLLKHGCEAVADAPFARPFGIPDGFIAAVLYGVLILLALVAPGFPVGVYGLRVLSIVAGVVNILGVFDMYRLGAWCFYCLLTTLLSPLLVWMAFVVTAAG